MPKNSDLFDTITAALQSWKSEHMSKDGAEMPSEDDIKSDVENATEAWLEQTAQDDENTSEDEESEDEGDQAA